MKNGQFIYETVADLARRMRENQEPTGDHGSKIHLNPDDYLSMKTYYNSELAQKDGSMVAGGAETYYSGYRIVADEMVRAGEVVQRNIKQ